MKKSFDSRILFGLLLIFGGGLALAQTMGYLNNVSNLFWGGVLLAVGLIFLISVFAGEEWNAFPAFILIGLGSVILFRKQFGDLGGGIFFGSIALAFWYIYFKDRVARWWAMIPAGVLTALALLVITNLWIEDLSGLFVLGGIGLTFFIVAITNIQERWWGLIPAGVLSTLAGITVVEERIGEFQTAGIFFLGLAITFLLVALLAKMKWAYLPALALGIMGVLGLASLLEFANYIWAIALIIIGIFILFRYFTNRA